MSRESSVVVLLAVCDATRRQRLAQVLSAAGFAVRQAEDLEEAVTRLHASGERLIVIVDADCMPLLRFAACDRRMVHHHAYVLLREPRTTQAENPLGCYPSLKLWIPSSSSAGELARVLDQAARALGGVPQGVPPLIAG